MPARVPRSLTAKILAESLVLLACLFGAIVVGGSYYHQAIVHEMHAKSADILRGIQVELAATGTAPLHDILLHLREEQGVDAIVLYDREHRVEASAESARLAGAAAEGPGQGLQIGQIQTPTGPLTAYVQTLPIESNGEPVGYVKIALAVEPQTAILRAFRSKMLWALIAAFCVTVALLCSSVVAAVRPLRDLSTHLGGVARDRLEPVDVNATTREVAVLQQTFNDMVRALQEKQRMEERLRQTQRLSAMGNLAAGVAHDIGNPLNAIRLTASHLSDLLRGNGNVAPEATRYAQAITDEVARLDAMVQNFLTLARERDAHRRPEAPDALVEEVLRLVRAEARRREITLVERLAAGAGPLDLDPDQMKGALVNLLVNAFEAAGPGGTVEIRSARENGHVRISVHDDGPGIPDDVREHMFEPYFSTKVDGTGLGLALSRTVVEHHGGTLEVASARQTGTTLTITLPAENAHA